MSRTTRHNTELHFYSPRLLEKLRALLKVKAALVEAPAGFGKSTAVWDRLNDARQKGSRVIPLLCHEEPAADIWRRFCAAIGEISPKRPPRSRPSACPTRTPPARPPRR